MRPGAVTEAHDFEIRKGVEWLHIFCGDFYFITYHRRYMVAGVFIALTFIAIVETNNRISMSNPFDCFQAVAIQTP